MPSRIPDLAPLAWLIPLALYDLRQREVPHIAFAAVPCFIAALTAALRGDWTLAVITGMIVAASERHHIPRAFRLPAFFAGLAACLGLLALIPFELSPGGIALVGFWLAYELGWWAGADALAAMALALLWPDARLLGALAASHLAIALIYKRSQPMMLRPRRLNPDELQTVGAPGLPAIALGAALFVIWTWWMA